MTHTASAPPVALRCPRTKHAEIVGAVAGVVTEIHCRRCSHADGVRTIHRWLVTVSPDGTPGREHLPDRTEPTAPPS